MILRLDQPEYLRPRGLHLDFPARAYGHCGRPLPESMPSGDGERGPLG